MDTLNKNAKGYNYKYTDLAEIHNYLESKGLAYYQFIEVIDGEDYVMTVKIDKDGTERSPLRGCRVVQATLSGNNNPAQEQGSALSYARRYSLLMAYGLCTTDDDAEMLSKRKVDEKDRPKLIEQICEIIDEKGLSADAVYRKIGVNSLEEIQTYRLTGMIDWLKKM